MYWTFSTLALAANLVASAADIPTDQPISLLLSTAQTHLAHGRTSEALEYYDAAITRDPSNYLTLFKRATTYLSLGRMGQAANDLDSVLALKPGFEGAHLQLAKIKARSADWAVATRHYQSAGKDASSPELVELAASQEASRLADEANKAGRWHDCINHASVAIMVALRAPHLRQMRAHCRLERGDVEEALSDLQHLLHLRPGDTGPHAVISASTFFGLADLDNGLSRTRKCLHSDPDSKPCKELYKQQRLIHKLYLKASNQLKKDQPATAGRTLVGTDDNPGLLGVVQHQIQELRNQGQLPANIVAKLNIKVVEMVCQAYSESNHRDTSKFCDELSKLDPDSFWASLYRGQSLMKAEDYEAAIAIFEKLVDRRPDQREKISNLLQKARIALKRSKTKDYYKVLGVAHNADQRQIKSAYRKVSKRFHPDKAAKEGIDRETAEKKMAAINEAYEVLSDEELRSRYDHGDDPNSNERSSPFPGGSGNRESFMFHQGGNGPFMFQQGDGRFKFQFGGGGPFGF